jgi:hypothetical protein
VVGWASNGAVHIGCSISGARFAGAIDEVQAYPMALSDAALAEVYRS